MRKILIADDGDERLIYLKDYLISLSKSNLTVVTANSYKELENNLIGVSVVVLPVVLKLTEKKQIVNTDIFLNLEVMKLLKGKIIFTGMLSQEARKLFEEFEIQVVEIFKSDFIALRNAIPTAEGVIQLIINNTKINLEGMNITLYGYGRVGIVLAKKLNALGAIVKVVSKERSELINAYGQGYIISDMKAPEIQLGDADVVINTIPSRIITEKQLVELKEDCFVIDVSSSPFGIDFDFCKKNNINAVLYLGIPKKIAPKSAGENLAQFISNYF